jgi:hypothetical protein
MHPTQSEKHMFQGLHGVRQAARNRKQERFTAVLHHLNVGLLRDSFYALKRQASPGIDGVKWQEYETGLEDRLTDLHSRVRIVEHIGHNLQDESIYRRLTGGNVRWAQLSYSEIRSPIDGVITDRPLYAAEMAAACTPLLTVMACAPRYLPLADSSCPAADFNSCCLPIAIKLS